MELSGRGRRSSNAGVGSARPYRGKPPQTYVPIYDPHEFRKALGPDAEADHDDDDYTSGIGSQTPRSRTTEDEIWARCLRDILADPRGPLRPHLIGTPRTLKYLAKASASSPHFAKVTEIIERAVFCSIVTERPLSFPPILLLSPPGVGKTFYCRAVARALGTTCIPISVNGTSDRGQLGGLTPLWRGAKMGRIAKGILIDSDTASPLFLLDELDKAPTLSGGDNTLDVLLSLLEQENAQAFVDEYLGVPIRAQHALWIASANTTRTISDPLLDRMLVIEVAPPTGEQARRVVRSIAADLIERRAPDHVGGLSEAAIEMLAGRNARAVSRVVDLAIAFAIARRRRVVTVADVTRSIELANDRRPTMKIGFLNA